jgi:aminoglycoside phosphotransferase (APT) family kinase protein
VCGIIASDLERFLGEPVINVAPIPQGHSGFTYWVDLKDRRAVLRVPPRGARITGTADIPRQARILDALHAAGLPVPAVLARSSEPIVDGRPFYLLEAVDGVRIDQLDIRERNRDLALRVVDLMKSLHSVPLSQTGLVDEAPVSAEDEVVRWTSVLERGRSEHTKSGADLEARLLRKLPAPQTPCLVHGDFHYGNLLFKEQRIVGILDWEIAQLGQPLVDVGCLALVGRMTSTSKHPPPGGIGIATSISEIAVAYGLNQGQELTWYLALAYYKYAAIYAYNLMLHLRGKRHDPVYVEQIDAIPHFLSEGIGLLS